METRHDPFEETPTFIACPICGERLFRGINGLVCVCGASYPYPNED